MKHVLFFERCLNQNLFFTITLMLPSWLRCSLVGLNYAGVFFTVVLDGGTLWPLQKFLQYIKYIILEITHSTIFLHLPSPHSWHSFNRYHFSMYIHVNTVFARYSHSHNLSLPPPLPLYQPPGRTCSAFLFSEFVKEKK
jgi:hypothetical protein